MSWPLVIDECSSSSVVIFPIYYLVSLNHVTPHTSILYCHINVFNNMICNQSPNHYAKRLTIGRQKKFNYKRTTLFIQLRQFH